MTAQKCFLAVLTQSQWMFLVHQHEAEHHLDTQQQGVKIPVNGGLVQQLDMVAGGNPTERSHGFLVQFPGIIKEFPDKLEGSKTSLILKSTKTESSCRNIFLTAALREELKHWLERLKEDEARSPDRYHDSGMLLRLPNGQAVEPVLIRKKFLKWQDAHPEFPRIVFHGLRHSSATYQLMISGGDIKSVQGTTGHASADLLVNTYAHIQQSSRMELGKKFENSFYAKPEASAQTPPVQGNTALSMAALLELLKDADPETKAQLRLALLT